VTLSICVAPPRPVNFLLSLALTLFSSKSPLTRSHAQLTRLQPALDGRILSSMAVTCVQECVVMAWLPDCPDAVTLYKAQHHCVDCDCSLPV
jgi:hypothetical protein